MLALARWLTWRRPISPLNAHTFHGGRSSRGAGVATLTTFGGRRLGVEERVAAAGELVRGASARMMAVGLCPPLLALLLLTLLLLLLGLRLRLLLLRPTPALPMTGRERRAGDDEGLRRDGDGEPPPRKLLAKSACALRGFLSAASWRLSEASPRSPPAPTLQADSRKDEWKDSPNQETESAVGRFPGRSYTTSGDGGCHADLAVMGRVCRARVYMQSERATCCVDGRGRCGLWAGGGLGDVFDKLCSNTTPSLVA